MALLATPPDLFKPRPKCSCLTGPVFLLLSAVPLHSSCAELTMAFRKALKRTLMVGGGAIATVFGLSQVIEYRKKQVS